MPDINNALAAQIQVPQIDLAGTLEKIGRIKNLNTENELRQQELQHRQFLYDQGGGYDPSERSTLEDVTQKHMDNSGRIGNILANDQSPSARQLAIQTAKDAGYKINPLVEQHIMTAPAGAVKQYGQNMQQAAQPASTSIEQGGNPTYNREFAGTTARLRAPLQPTNPSDQNGHANGSPAAAGPGTSLLESNKIAEKRGDQAVTNKEKYDKEGTAASLQSAALHQMLVDASQVRTGFGSSKEEAARKVVTALGDMVPSLKPYTDAYADKSAAFQSFEKNAGIVSRAITQEVGTTAASGLDMVTRALISNENTNKGVDINGHQLIGMSHFKQARSLAAQKWSDDHGGDMTNFESDFNKKASVSAWMLKELPPDQQKIVADYLDQSKAGKEVKKNLVRQLDNIRKEKLDEGVY